MCIVYIKRDKDIVLYVFFMVMNIINNSFHPSYQYSLVSLKNYNTACNPP
jgi:hypothetical protein